MSTNHHHEALNKLRDECYNMACQKGWWDYAREWPELIALMHSELSEALEDYRENKLRLSISSTGKPEGLPSELADVLIRVFDAAGYFNIDLAEAVAKKMEYNAARPYRHGGKLA